MATFDLDHTLIEFLPKKDSTIQKKGHWTIRHAVEGVQIFGGIGSGKTSGSGRYLALKYLQAGFGGLVLTVKPTEKQDWEEYCRLTGRSADLIVLEPGGPHHFNFLEFESSAGKAGAAMTDNIVTVLKTVIRAGEEKGGGKSNDPFWDSALDMLLFNVIDLCRLAYGAVSVEHMYDIVQTIPQDKAAFEAGKAKADSAFFNALRRADDRVNTEYDAWYYGLSEEQRNEVAEAEDMRLAAEEALPDYRLMNIVFQFFSDTFVNLNDRTRSIIDFSFSGFLFRLLREPIYSLFCKNSSTVTPHDCLRGKIILLNLPVKLYHKVGRDCQILFKYIWQRAMEKRDTSNNPLPVFLWADEAQNFLHEHDAEYQATARSSMIATVYISQNLPNYFASMSGERGSNRVKSFLGTLGTKIFHANADIETNRYASELIGDRLYVEQSGGVTTGTNISRTLNESVKHDRLIRPEEFAQLLTGGPRLKYRVEGILHRQGEPVRDNDSHVKMIFTQDYIPPPL
jgi:TraM recognition site of TraD and TraG